MANYTPTSMSLTEDDQQLRDKVDALGFGLIETWRHGAKDLLTKAKDKPKK